MTESFKGEVKTCNNLKQLRATAKRIPDFSESVNDSILHTEVILT